MIFRRNDPTPSKTAMNTSRNQNSQQRREPELSARPQPQSPTPPMSPIAMAQARRTTTTSGNYGRNDQMRKLTVGRDISLNGEIATCDHLVVEGTVSATIKGGQILEIMESGCFSGVVDIEQADIAGKFDGDLTVRGKLLLRPTAIVTGTIRYTQLQVETGATIQGQIATLTPAAQNNGTMETPSAFQALTPNAVETTTPVATTHTTAPEQNNGGSYSLSSVINQPGFLKASA